MWLMTKKKVIQKFWRMKVKKFVGKRVKLGKNVRKSEIFSEIGGNLKQRGNCIMVSGGMDAPGKMRC